MLSKGSVSVVLVFMASLMHRTLCGIIRLLVLYDLGIQG